jgi:hypothetical protein
MVTAKQHTKANVQCPNCGATGENNWRVHDELPQVGTTYTCCECGEEAFLYDSSGYTRRGEEYEWQPVTDSMRMTLKFLDIVGTYPDDALSNLYIEGLTRQQAIDYHIIDREKWPQTRWAHETRRDQSTVSESVTRARETLSEQTTLDDHGIEPPKHACVRCSTDLTDSIKLIWEKAPEFDPRKLTIDAECTKCRTSVGATYGEQRMIEILEAAGIDPADAEPNEEIEA